MPETQHDSFWKRTATMILKWIRRGGMPLYLLAASAVGSLWGFVEILDEVQEGETHAADAFLLRLFREANNLGTPRGPSWLAEGMRDLTALGSTTILILITLAVAGFLLLSRRFRAFLFLAISVTGGAAVSFSLKALIARPRPDVVPHLVEVSTQSFPSGHSMLSAVVYLTLGALLSELVPDRRRRTYVLAVAVLLAVLVGISRVYLGVHYPTDVIAGWSLGLFWGSLCSIVAYSFKRQHKLDPE